MSTARFGPESAKKVQAFLAPDQPNGPTNLLVLDKLAGSIGVENIYVKDENGRLGTKAFKVQGV